MKQLSMVGVAGRVRGSGTEGIVHCVEFNLECVWTYFHTECGLILQKSTATVYSRSRICKSSAFSKLKKFSLDSASCSAVWVCDFQSRLIMARNKIVFFVFVDGVKTTQSKNCLLALFWFLVDRKCCKWFRKISLIIDSPSRLEWKARSFPCCRVYGVRD